MTITTQVSRAVFTGNGSTTAFDFTFKALAASDLVVSVWTSGVEAVKTITTDYTVSLLTEGGTVTFLSAPANGTTVVVQRNMAYTQPTDFENQGSFYPATHGRSFDRATMQIQQIEDLMGRSPTLPASTALTFDPVLPQPAARRYLVVNSDNDGWALSDESPVADPTLRQDITNSGLITLKTDLAASSGSSLVGHIASGTGAAARTLQSVLRDSITPKDYDAAGDGSTDDTAALQDTIDEADGRTIDLLGLTYKVTSTLSLPSNTHLRNGRITFATAADSDVLFEAFGSVGTQYTLTAAPTKGSTSVAVSSATGLATGDWCFLQSTDDFSAIDSGKRGEWVRVLSVSGLTVNLEQRVRMTYTSGYTMYKPSLITNITLENLTLTGNGYTGSAAQYGIRAYLCRNVNIIRCVADSFGYAAYSLETVLGGNVTDTTATRSNLSTGAAYGVAMTGGCQGVTVKGGMYAYHRHGVTVGGTFFTEYGHAITGITTMACADAGVDVHPNAMGITITGNTIDCFTTDTTQTGDGITAQGASINIIGNIIRGWARDGILCQPLTSAPAQDDGWVISGNQLSNPRGVSGADGIVFSNEKGTGNTIRGLVISGNVIQGESATTGRGILIQNTTSGGPIRNYTISGNAVYSRSEALYIVAANLELIEDGAITGNSFNAITASAPVVSLVANADVSKYLTCISLAGNTIRGGTYGITLSNAPPRVNRGVNVIQGFATAATTGTFASTNGDDVTT